MPANTTGLTAPPIFRREALDPSELEAFTAGLERDGFVLFDGCLTREGAEGLAAEMLQHPDYKAWLGGGEANRGQKLSADNPRFGLRPFDDKGPFSDQLFDAPLVRHPQSHRLRLLRRRARRALGA